MLRAQRVISLTITLIIFIAVGVLAIAFWKAPSYFTASDSKLDRETFEKVSGVKLADDHLTPPSGNYTVILNRPELSTVVNGVEVNSLLGLKPWITLTGTQKYAVLLGDVPLKQEEVNEVILAAVHSGLIVTSLHNQFLMDSGRIMSLHLEGIGTQEYLSTALGKFLKGLAEEPVKMTKSRAKAQLRSTPLNPAHSNLSQQMLESLLWKGKMSNGIFHVSVGRGTTLDGRELGEANGVASWADFGGTEEDAVVNGDIATLQAELPFVLEDLIGAEIRIASIHSHMTQENPRLIFIHFFGRGRLASLADRVKAAFWEKEHFQAQ